MARTLTPVSRWSIVAICLCSGVAAPACVGMKGQSAASVSPAPTQPGGADIGGGVPFEESLDRGAPLEAALSVSTERRFQTLEGFGAAIAWYQDLITGDAAQGTYEFLFPELGLDILRVRNRFERSNETDAAIEQDVEIFERATAALGHAPVLLISSWSPPASLKANGREKCNGEAQCTLKKKQGQFVYDEYATWWKRAILSYRAMGLDPTFISMQNEPDFIPPDWEGCKFAAEETAEYPGYGRALEKVHAALKTLPNPPKLLGPEVLGIHYNKVPDYLEHLDQSLLYGVAHHIYERGDDAVWDWRYPGPDSFVDEMLTTAAATSKPLLQTEFNTDEDRGIDGGFETAWLVHNSLTEEGVAAFLYWDLVWPGKRGLVGFEGRTPHPRDQYYAMRHYARFTDPGYVRVGAGSDRTELVGSAYLAPDESRLTIVALNISRKAIDAALRVQDYAHSSTSVYQTSFRPGHSKQWEALGGLGTPPNIKLPAQSISTIVLER